MQASAYIIGLNGAEIRLTTYLRWMKQFKMLISVSSLQRHTVGVISSYCKNKNYNSEVLWLTDWLGNCPQR